MGDCVYTWFAQETSVSMHEPNYYIQSRSIIKFRAMDAYGHDDFGYAANRDAGLLVILLTLLLTSKEESGPAQGARTANSPNSVISVHDDWSSPRNYGFTGSSAIS
jgi:hypothetical protein